MSEPSRGLLDTSVVVDHDLIDTNLLPDASAIAAVTLAELAAGPHATDDERERVRRQDRLQWAAETWDPCHSTPMPRVRTREYLPRLVRPGDRAERASPTS